MTSLEVVNQILRRLREDTVTNITDTTQAQLIHEFVKDAVIELQDMHNWSMLKSTYTVTTAASDYDYTLTAIGKEFKVVNVWNDTDEVFLREQSAKYFHQMLNITNTTSDKPIYYGFDTHDSSGDPTLLLYPIPDGVYSIDVNLILPQSRDDLTESTETKIPEPPVIWLAWAHAISERGEDGGMNSGDVRARAYIMAADAIALDYQRTGLNPDFYVE